LEKEAEWRMQTEKVLIKERSKELLSRQERGLGQASGWYARDFVVHPMPLFSTLVFGVEKSGLGNITPFYVLVN
jgi:hypothetical protein